MNATQRLPEPEAGRAISAPAGRAAASRLDLAGAILVWVSVAWALVAAAVSGGDPWPVVGLLLAAAGSLVLARLVAGLEPAIVPGAIVVAALALLLLAPRAALDPRAPLGGPFGYKNAAGAFFVQAAIASLMVLVLRRERYLRVSLALLALAFALVPLASRSLAAVTLLAMLPLAALGVRGVRAARLSIAGCAALFLVALLVTGLLGAWHSGRGVENEGSLVDSALTERRLILWHEALVLIGDHPLAGVGAGRFQEESPTAVSDRDARWAHNGFLQQGAESGVVGLLLAALVFLWGFARLWAAPRPDAVTALAAVALAALGIHATVDYVLHFPALSVTAAGLVGVGISARRPRPYRSLRPGDDLAPGREVGGGARAT